jgi:ABC-type multidrug transport system ATPase subunit/ABC-type multidrug transport system permease subunit
MSDIEDPVRPMLSHSTAGRGLAWRGLGFSVSTRSLIDRLRRLPDQGPKQILVDAAGIVNAGEILFIMGPSGAGKSSMLDAIAQRVAAPVSGNVFVDGSPLNPDEFKHSSKYVEQSEHFFESLTTRETLLYAASFYCSDPDARSPRVDAVLSTLGLEDCRDTKVGGTFFRGLSGGQLRRLAIGVELVAQPGILLLDEPTSGLDATSAHATMSHLTRIAKSGVTVVCTIHQPSQRIFEMSHKLLLLTAGRVAFFGPTTNVVPYFERLDCVMPPRTSVAEWLLDELNADFHTDRARWEKIVSAWASSSEEAALQSRINEFVANAPTGSHPTAAAARPPHNPVVSYKRSAAAQIGLLAKRSMTDALRSPAVIYLRAVMYSALGFLIGIAWLRISASADRIIDILGSLFFAAAFYAFMSIAVLPVYLGEKLIVQRERNNGSYSVFAYLSSHFVVEAAFLAVLAVLLTATVYPLTGLNPTLSAGAFFCLSLFCTLLVAESMMILIAAVVPYLLVGIAMGAFTFGLFMCVQGYLTSIDHIPWPLRWMKYIALHSYSFAAFCINEFEGRTYAASPHTFPAFVDPVSGDSVIASLHLPLNNRWANIGIMVCMVAVYRVMAFLYISKFHTGKK